jgi:parallel beta-helix repeat protein
MEERMRKFVTLAFVIAAVLCWSLVLMAEVPANVQAAIDKEANGVQLTPLEKQLVEKYLTDQNIQNPPETDTQWGPDGWGYQAADPASGGDAYNWIDITGTGTEFWAGENRDDDWLGEGTSPPYLQLPFTFPFYNGAFDSISVSANVLIKFTSAYVSYSSAVPNASYPYRIDPWCYDMYHVADTSHYYYEAFADVGADVDTLVVSFIDARYYSTLYRNDPAYSKTLQVLLFSDGKIKFQYNSLGSIIAGSPYSSGIDDNLGPNGVGVGNAFTNGLAITFTPPPPGIILGNPTVTPAAGNTSTNFNYSVAYRNTTGAAPTTMDIYIDGSPYAMTDPGGDYLSGVTMTYGPLTLAVGTHNFYFYAEDGTYTQRLPESGTISGPAVYAPLSGSYDIGGGANDFANLVTFAAALQAAGMSGPVITNVFSGTFNGQVNLPGTISGLGATNTLMIQNAPGEHPIINSTSGYGFYFTGADYVTIRGLEITNCYYSGIYNYYSGTDSSTHNAFKRNYIHNVGTAGSYHGIYLYRGADCQVVSNEIEGDYYGIYNYYGDRNLIVNNMVYGTGYYGIYNYYGSNNGIYYNSVYAPTGYCLYGYFYNSVGTMIKDNIFYQAGSGSYYAFYSSSYLPAASDYNDLYAPSANVGYYSGARASLVDWQTATGMDANSISADPGFVATNDLHIVTFLPSPVDGAGTPIAGITIDFDTETRNVTTPDIGCDEFTFTPMDYCVDLEPESQTAPMVAGGTWDYTFTVDNCGGLNDTYDLSANVTGAAWDHQIMDETGTNVISSLAVLAGETGTFLLRVTAPGDAVLGDSSFAEVIAHSQSERNIYADTAYTTSFISPFYSIPIDWVEIAGPAAGPGTDAGIYGDDVNMGPFNIGFAFPFYDCEFFSSIRLCSNGWASFTSTATTYSNVAIPNAAEPNNLLAAYWDDFITSTTGSVWYYYDSANDRFIAEWYQVPHLSTNGSYTFELILYPDGTIDYLYNNITHGTPNDCTIGIENATGTIGVQATYNGSGPFDPVSGTAIRFMPVCAPEDYCVDLNPETLGSIVGTGDSTDYTMTVTNCGALDDTYDLSVNVTGEAWRTEIWDLGLTQQIDSIVVASLNSEQFNVRVVVPDTATIGQTSTAAVVADSRYGTARNVLTDTSWVTTTATEVISLEYFENFDVSNGGFESGGTGCWEWGTPTYASGPPGAYSGSYCWGTVLSSTYAASSCCTLDSPPINLDAPAILTFWHWFDIEDYWDGGIVQISTDGGATWTQLTPVGGYPYTYTNNSCIGSIPNYGGLTAGWVQAQFDLSAYAGDVVILRWMFGSDTSVQYAGWYIDDVAISYPVFYVDAASTCIRVTPTGGAVNDGAKKLTGASYDVYATVQSAGTLPADITINATDGLGWASSTSVTGLAPNTCQEVLFPDLWIGGTAGVQNTMTVTAVAAGDTIPENNSAFKSVTVPGTDGDTLMVDDGTNTYANAWYFYADINVMATQFFPSTYPAQINWVAAWIIGPGSIYWPWPDATQDQYWISIWLEDPMNPGYPAEPPVWSEHCMYSSSVLEGWAYVAPDEPVIVPDGSFWIGVQNVTNCASPGSEGLAMDAATNYPAQAWYRLDGVWYNIDEYAGDDLVRANLAGGIESPLVTISVVTGVDEVTDAVLDWEPITGAAEYKIYKSTTVAGPYTLIDSTTGTQYVDVGAVVAGEFSSFYYVTADNVARGATVARATPNGAIGPVTVQRAGASTFQQRVLQQPKSHKLQTPALESIMDRQTNNARKSVTKAAPRSK